MSPSKNYSSEYVKKYFNNLTTIGELALINNIFIKIN